jgi:hypothetical protein
MSRWVGWVVIRIAAAWRGRPRRPGAALHGDPARPGGPRLVDYPRRAGRLDPACGARALDHLRPHLIPDALLLLKCVGGGDPLERRLRLALLLLDLLRSEVYTCT